MITCTWLTLYADDALLCYNALAATDIPDNALHTHTAQVLRLTRYGDTAAVALSESVSQSDTSQLLTISDQVAERSLLMRASKNGCWICRESSIIILNFVLVQKVRSIITKPHPYRYKLISQYGRYTTYLARELAESNEIYFAFNWPYIKQVKGPLHLHVYQFLIPVDSPVLSLFQKWLEMSWGLSAGYVRGARVRIEKQGFFLQQKQLNN